MDPRQMVIGSLALAAVGLWAPTARAGDLNADLQAARAAVEAGDADAALEHADAAQQSAEQLGQVARPTLLARVWYYRGAALHMKGDDAHMDAWRNALVIDNDYAWDEALVADGVAWNLFEALRSEVRDRPQVTAHVPEATGEAQIFVDGERVRFEETVLQGVHLGQISCPDGAVVGTWTDLKRKVKWLKLCPNGVDTTVVVAEAEEDDEWSSFGPAFGAEEDAGGDEEAGDEAVSSEALVTAPAPGGQPEVEIIRKKVVWPAFFAGVGAAAAAGTMQAVALRQNAAYNDLSNPDGLNQGDLEQLRKATNRNQTLVYPLLAVSGGLFFAATYQW